VRKYTKGASTALLLEAPSGSSCSPVMLRIIVLSSLQEYTSQKEVKKGVGANKDVFKLHKRNPLLYIS
jgi:hypothetical protein